MDKIKEKYFRIKKKISLLFKINWIKTLYLNFKVFSFQDAKKLPIIIFGKCMIGNLDGNLILEGPITFARIVIGQRYQIFVKEKGVSELNFIGDIKFKGRAQFGMDCKIHVDKDAVFTIGDMASLGNNSSLICTKKITMGNFCRIGQEAYITDSNFHQMKNTITGEVYPKSFEISLGNYNFIGTRVSIMGKTKTPDYTTIASSTLINKDFSQCSMNIILGGVPAKIVKNNISRDWDGEKNAIEKYLKII